ncbi:whey acidic protein-like [Arvicola amphibius]|uniref:whey acidic protein-like n=1 Tax=Arvicola amphibius TaxID=1047088 RepID=UPI001C07F023|nr:whey acidic protein-like [Arvicola amphibius]
MRCFISLVLGLLALEVALAQNPREQVFDSVQVMCPEARASENPECINCRTKAECAQNALCCRSSCNAICKTPVDIDAPKAGHCPWNPVNLIPTGPCLLKDSCSRDSDCTGNKKCCKYGCAMQCKSPQAVGMSVNEQGLEKQTALPLKAGPGEFMIQTGPFALDLREQ